MKNWKTTLFGTLTAVSMYFASSTNATVSTIAQALASVGVFLLGGNAKDNNKTGV